MTHNNITLKTALTILTVVFVFSNTALADDWKRDVTLGFNQSSGNTDKTELSANGSISKNFDHSQFASGINVYYSDVNDSMDSQKWDSTTNYSFDFGDEYEWFNVYKLTIDHDFFADIDYRLLPSIGIGHWFERDADWTWSADASLGYQITKFRSGAEDEEGAAFIAHTYAKKKIMENAYLSEDLSIIPSLEGAGTLIKSITEFTNPLNENMDLSVKYLLDHDTDPAVGKKKTDTKILVGIKYSF